MHFPIEELDFEMHSPAQHLLVIANIFQTASHFFHLQSNVEQNVATRSQGAEGAEGA